MVPSTIRTAIVSLLLSACLHIRDYHVLADLPVQPWQYKLLSSESYDCSNILMVLFSSSIPLILLLSWWWPQSKHSSQRHDGIFVIVRCFFFFFCITAFREADDRVGTHLWQQQDYGISCHNAHIVMLFMTSCQITDDLRQGDHNYRITRESSIYLKWYTAQSQHMYTGY